MEEKDDSNENIIPIETLKDYFNEIDKLKKYIEEDEGAESSAQQLYFRGQANSDWDITPSVYRGNLLAIEHELIYSAHLRNPAEFRTTSSNFERLTKLQHYGLPTRLLDVTTNPFVALYFACQPHDEIQENEETGYRKAISKDGSVFYKRTYNTNFQDTEVQTVAFLSSMDIKGSFTLEECLTLLEENHIYSHSDAKVCRKNNYNSLINSLQKNHFVVPAYNNERLIRQSGAFLLSGCYNITQKSTNIGDSTIQRAYSNLANEFEAAHFVIPAQRKPAILAELNLFNINEGSLFPELEHQMSHIIKQITSQKNSTPPGQFIKSPTNKPAYESDTTNLFVDNTEAEEIFKLILQKNIPDLYHEELLGILMENLFTDWYKKEGVWGTMQSSLKKALFAKPEFNQALAAEKAKRIIDEIREKMEK